MSFAFSYFAYLKKSYCFILQTGSIPTAANVSKSCIFKEKQATTGSERQRLCTVCFSPLKISFTGAISLVGNALTSGYPEFESLEDLSQSCPPSLPLSHDYCSSSTNSNLNFVVHIFSFSFQSMRHMRAVSCWLFRDVIQKLCFGSQLNAYKYCRQVFEPVFLL